MNMDACNQHGAIRYSEWRGAWLAAVLLTGLSGCGGDKATENESSPASQIPLESGDYELSGKENFMSLRLDVDDSKVSASFVDPEMNATKGVAGCLGKASGPNMPSETGAILLKGDEDAACTITLAAIRAGAVMVQAAGCDGFCTGGDGSLLLTGEYIGFAQAPVDEEPPVSLDSEPSPNLLAEPPVKIEIFQGQRTWVRVVSVVDRVAIQDISVNRGNCDAYPGEDQIAISDRVLGFGMSWEYPLNCRLLEVEVTTDLGVWTFEFN